MSGIISAVVPGSPAALAGLEAGDTLLAVNGRQLTDLIDYQFAVSEEELTLTARKAAGESLQATLHKEAWEDLGLSFAAEVFDGIRSCRNHCLFCFIDQLQPAPRESLLLKDDDYRMSFLEGNFITGTNLSEADLQRIREMKLSPLYISVHATEAALRGHLLGLPKPAPVLPLLQQLIEGGAQVHTQIVLVPGLNSGAGLTRTVSELAALAPGVASIGIVPLGLTRYRSWPRLRLGTAWEASSLLLWLRRQQRKYVQLYGTRLVFAADEFYIRSGRPFPPARDYEEFAQLENGIGMAALFAAEWKQNLRGHQPHKRQWCKTGVVTGRAGAAVLKPLRPSLQRLTQGSAELLTVENRFYGPEVTVSGLLTGSDLIAALPKGLYERYIIPDSMLKHSSDIFLDDSTVEAVTDALQTPVTVAQSTAAGLLAALIGD